MRTEEDGLVIPLTGGVYYVSLIDNKLHPLKAGVPPEIIVDTYSNQVISLDEHSNPIPYNLEMIINLNYN